MNAIFADSSYFIALLVLEDEAHRDAVEFATQFSGKVITSQWVLAEVADALSRPRLRGQIADFLLQLSQSREVEIIPADSNTFATGLALFAARRDKSWSLTDCISFTLMQHRQLANAAKTDQHFAQAGFNVLLPRSAP